MSAPGGTAQRWQPAHPAVDTLQNPARDVGAPAQPAPAEPPARTTPAVPDTAAAALSRGHSTTWRPSAPTVRRPGGDRAPPRPLRTEGAGAAAERTRMGS